VQLINNLPYDFQYQFESESEKEDQREPGKRGDQLINIENQEFEGEEEEEFRPYQEQKKQKPAGHFRGESFGDSIPVEKQGSGDQPTLNRTLSKTDSFRHLPPCSEQEEVKEEEYQSELSLLKSMVQQFSKQIGAKKEEEYWQLSREQLI